MGLTYSMSDLKKGLRIEMDGVPYRITEYQHVKPGKGAAFVRTKIKNFLNGKVVEKTFHAGDKCEQPDMETKDFQYLYDDGEMLQFMDIETYDQIGLSYEQTEDAAKWIIDGMNVTIVFHNGKAISVDAPEIVELVITETAPNFKGDTSSGGKKPATLESGAVVQIPYHVLEGDKIRVNTVEGEYLEKVK
jgi:elongation factor P